MVKKFKIMVQRVYRNSYQLNRKQTLIAEIIFILLHTHAIKSRYYIFFWNASMKLAGKSRTCGRFTTCLYIIGSNYSGFFLCKYICVHIYLHTNNPL